SGGVLGSAGTTGGVLNFPNAPIQNTYYHRALVNKYAGIDTNGATAEINTTFNSDVDNGCLGGGSRFYYGLDNSTPAQRINLLVVLLHEMGHGLGFSSFVNGTTGALPNGFPDVYTRHMFDRTTGKYWHQMTDTERQASALNSNNVMWDGGSTRISSSYLTNGTDPLTGRVMLFTPTTFQGGSSISHWSTAASPNLLMEPNITNGLPINLDLTRQFMRDIGWYRDTNADLVPDSITNVLPSGGTLVIGSNVSITWTNNGGFNRNVSIDLSTDGGVTFTPIASDIANTGSFTYTIPNNPTARGRIRVREHNFVDPAGVSSATFAISETVAPDRTKFDFDGDGRADVSVFRPSTGIWYLQQSTAGFTGVSFGLASDKIVPADFDGDGKTDVAVYRSGTWYLNRTTAGFTGIAFGAANDVPVPADFDGDGKADLAVFRPSNGGWYIFNLATNQTSSAQFGISEDRPVAADYDGDGKTDIAVFRPSNGTWYMQRSQLGFTGVQFGDANDKAVPADYDGDGKTDIAVFRPSNGTWYMQRSQLGFTGVQFGDANDKAVPADYDGDGKTD
ncbi:MAG TPA: FG-GAP-like repeat-containing protein, partial [Pyrinomonadaceae bacterium]|nr:FG-GAP-like repeat-containing protein [Pyrinomonadaceae bacterium]